MSYKIKERITVDVEKLESFSEAGMGFYVFEDEKEEDLYIIDSAGSGIQMEEGFQSSGAIQGAQESDDFPYFELGRDSEFEETPVTLPQTVRCLSRRQLSQKIGLAGGWVKSPGAFKLIGRDTLQAATPFYRYLSQPSDFRFHNGELKADTYLTTSLDKGFANTGFAAVGRFALPLPIPASHVIEYEVPSRTKIEVGTVEPDFGQSGGGVEVRLPFRVKNVVRQGGSKLPDY